jgi:3-dehydroquinate synthase class II
MAEGTTKPIGEIRQGDRVLATDALTGKHHARIVTRVGIRTDTFIHLTINGESLTG